MAACRGLDLVPLVRVPSAEANIIAQVLDMVRMALWCR